MESGFGAQTGAAALAAALFHSVWQCALLAVAAAAAMQMLRRQSAALRHNVGMAFLLAMVGLPAWTFLRHLLQPFSASNSFEFAAMAPPESGIPASIFMQPSSGWTAPLCVLWIIGVAYVLACKIGGLWWLVQLERRDFQPLPPEWRARLDRLQRMYGITRKISFRIAEEVVVPFTARLLRPVVWIPAALLIRLPSEQVEALLAHELAHIHRLDWLWNGVQCCVEALLYFHPGVWWLSRRIREEREQACDDHAATACASAVVVAEALAALAQDRRSRSRLLLAANGGSLMSRVEHLVSAPPAAGRAWAPISLAALLAAGGFLAVPLASGYAAYGRQTSPLERDSASPVSDRMGGIEAYTRGPLFERAARAPEQPARIIENAASNIEEAALTHEQSARDAEQAVRDREQARRDAEQAVRDREQAVRDAEQAVRERERVAGEARQAPSVEGQARPLALPGRLDAQRGYQGHARLIDGSEATQALVRLVSADPGVVKLIGSSAVVTSDGYTGRWGSNEQKGMYGVVSLSFTLTGPKGRASILATAIAMQDDRQWRLTKLNVTDFTPLG